MADPLREDVLDAIADPDVDTRALEVLLMGAVIADLLTHPEGLAALTVQLREMVGL